MTDPYIDATFFGTPGTDALRYSSSIGLPATALSTLESFIGECNLDFTSIHLAAVDSISGCVNAYFTKAE